MAAVTEETKKINHKLIAHDGRYIVLPPGMGSQDLPNLSIPDNIFTPDTTQKYPLGTKFVSGIRVYYYCKAYGDVDPEWGCYKAKKTNTVAVAPTQSTTIDPETGLAAGVIGSYEVTVTIDTEIGHLATGVLSKDELAGGFIVIGNGTSQHPQMAMIVSHPALTTTGGSLTLRLDMKLGVAVTAATTTIELMESPFIDVKADGSGGDYVTFIGQPACSASTGEYFWCQTWGPCWITSDGNTCDSARDRTLVYVGNGSIVSSNDVTMESGFQIAGVALDMSGSAASNAPMVLLQLIP
jgi:hypothetical protein